MRAALLALIVGLGVIVGAPAEAAAPRVPAQQVRVGSPGLAVEARAVLPVRVQKTRRPGLLRVSNPNDHWVRFLWGTFRRAQPDGRKRIEAYRTVTVRVERRRVDWIALLDGYQVAGQGSVRGIRL